MGAAAVPIAIVGSSIISGIAGSLSGKEQADAARESAQMQADAAKYGMNIQKEQHQQTRNDLQPWRGAGQLAVSSLGNVGLGGQFDQSSQYNPYSQFQQSQGLPQFEQFGVSPEESYQQQTQPFNFDPASDPGYQFRLQQGTDAIEGSAAARGGLFSGQTGKDLAQYGQGLASQEYQNAFARDLAQKQNQGQAYGNAFGQNIAGQQAGFNQDLTGRQYGSQEFYNALNSDIGQKQNAFNRLSGVAGMGQSSAAMTGQMGQNSAMNQAQLAGQGASALGQGQLGAAQAYGNAAQNWSNQLNSGLGQMLNYNMLNRIYPQGGAV